MTHPTLEGIKTLLITLLNKKYGYCGCADMDKKAIINSGGDGEDLIITIEDQSEPK